MTKRRIEPAVLALLISSAVIGVLIDITVVVENKPAGFQLVVILVADIPIFIAAVADYYFSPKASAFTPVSELIPSTMNPKALHGDPGNQHRTKTQREIEVSVEVIPMKETEMEESEVFLETSETEKPKLEIEEILERMKSKTAALDDNRALPRETAVEMTVRHKVAEPKKTKTHYLSPEKLKAPAFICRCGHPHRFVCLVCGMNIETAVKKKKMHWVEWVPEITVAP